jgi:hypothetical protein
MNVTLDGQNLFDQQQLNIETSSIRRASVERSMPGLDGVLNIDLGRRSRQVIQKGTLQAKSRTQMNDRIGAISAYLDGSTHMLTTSNGEVFENLRMDVFKAGKEQISGAGMVIDYEIAYTQLTV